jgi:hypothetical protein
MGGGLAKGRLNLFMFDSRAAWDSLHLSLTDTARRAPWRCTRLLNYQDSYAKVEDELDGWTRLLLPEPIDPPDGVAKWGLISTALRHRREAEVKSGDLLVISAPQVDLLFCAYLTRLMRVGKGTVLLCTISQDLPKEIRFHSYVTVLLGVDGAKCLKSSVAATAGKSLKFAEAG